jgi:hypothetical protein
MQRTARPHRRMLNLRRAVADLARRERIRAVHLAEAIRHRARREREAACREELDQHYRKQFAESVGALYPCRPLAEKGPSLNTPVSSTTVAWRPSEWS